MIVNHKNTGDLREAGINLSIIVDELIANQNLAKLLHYTDYDPLSHTEEVSRKTLFNKLIRFIPRLLPSETSESVVAVFIESGLSNANEEFRDFIIKVQTYVPLTQWVIKDKNLRPFAIMSEVQKSLNGLSIDGVGKLRGGEVEINFLTEEMSCYEQTFILTTYA